MTDDDGDGVYSLEVGLDGGTVEYKFTVDGWTDQEMFDEGTACTSTIDGYTNRTLDVTGDAVLDVASVESPARVVWWRLFLAARTRRFATTMTPNVDGSCVYGDGPEVGISVTDALCSDGTGAMFIDTTVTYWNEFMYDFGEYMFLYADTVLLGVGVNDLVQALTRCWPPTPSDVPTRLEFTISAPDTLAIEVAS